MTLARERCELGDRGSGSTCPHGYLAAPDDYMAMVQVSGSADGDAEGDREGSPKVQDIIDQARR